MFLAKSIYVCKNIDAVIDFINAKINIDVK